MWEITKLVQLIITHQDVLAKVGNVIYIHHEITTIQCE